MKTLLVALWLLPGVAFAGTWAGVPLDRLEPLGLGTPALDERADRWRAGLPDGGFVSFAWFVDGATATAAFEGQLQTASTLAPVRVSATVAGDGQWRIVRVDNVIIAVRSHAGRALAIVEALRGALVTDAGGVWATRVVDGQTLSWDRVGRRRN